MIDFTYHSDMRFEMSLVPAEEIQKRIGEFQKSLQREGLDGALIYQNVDSFYFTGTCQNGALYVPASGDPLFMVIKNIERARMESPLKRIVKLKNPVAVREVLRENKTEIPLRLGLEMDVIPAKLFERLVKSGFTVYQDISMSVRMQRSVKSDYEISMMKKAAGILKKVFENLPNHLEQGITETELSARVEYDLRKNGHQGVVRMRAFNMELYAAHVAFGPSSATPVHFDGPVGVKGMYPAAPQIGGNTKLKPGMPVLADIVAGVGGYNVDCTRSFALKYIDEKWMKAHQDSLKLNNQIVKHLQPGAIPSEIYVSIVKAAKEMGYEDCFMASGENQVKFVAHGIGLEVDEIPVVAGSFNMPLFAGNTLAVEPKIIKTGKGGVGIENTYHVTKNGARNLTGFNMDLVVV
jgi:Xaa-Pro dipeptidase